MKEFLKELSKSHIIGAVGGSDLVKIKEQLLECIIKIVIKLAINIFNFVFTENGLVSFKDHQRFHEKVFCSINFELNHIYLINRKSENI